MMISSNKRRLDQFFFDQDNKKKEKLAQAKAKADHEKVLEEEFRDTLKNIVAPVCEEYRIYLRDKGIDIRLLNGTTAGNTLSQAVLSGVTIAFNKNGDTSQASITYSLRIFDEQIEVDHLNLQDKDQPRILNFDDVILIDKITTEDVENRITDLLLNNFSFN